MSLRVAIDAREVIGHPTGVGRYLRELLVRWAAAPYASGSTCLLLAPTPAPAWLSAVHGAGTQVQWQHVPGAAGTIWEQGPLGRAMNRARPDVVFAPAYTAPLRARAPIVLAMHDVSFAAHPEWFGLREGLRQRLLARWSAKKATAILTLTRFSAGEIVTRLGVRGARIHVTPLAVDYWQAQLAGDAAGARAESSTAPSRRSDGVLFVGSIFARRHLPLLIEGLARGRAAAPGLTLEVIGDNRTRPPVDLLAVARSHGVADAVRVDGYVDDEALAAAYGRNGIFAFLSSYEGFGLPPLEAMQAGLATVVLDTPVAREVYGDGAAYVRAGDAEGLGALLARLGTHAPAREALIARGRVVAQSYRWDDTAERTWRVLALTAGRQA